MEAKFLLSRWSISWHFHHQVLFLKPLLYVLFYHANKFETSRACRDTFQCRVFLCLWHVRRAWFKGLLKKCFNFDVQKEIFRLLGHILYCTKSGPNAMDTIEEFMQIFIDQREFMEYFKKRWLTRIGIQPYLHLHCICYFSESMLIIPLPVLRHVDRCYEDSSSFKARTSCCNRVLPFKIEIETL